MHPHSTWGIRCVMWFGWWPPRHHCDNITPILKDLHWLPIRKRIEFKSLLLTFKWVTKHKELIAGTTHQSEKDSISQGVWLYWPLASIHWLLYSLEHYRWKGHYILNINHYYQLIIGWIVKTKTIATLYLWNPYKRPDSFLTIHVCDVPMTATLFWWSLFFNNRNFQKIFEEMLIALQPTTCLQIFCEFV